MGKNSEKTKADDLQEVLIAVNRVAKVVKGGRRFSFSVVLVIGDRKGRVGYGLGKAKEVTEARAKAYQAARRAMVRVNLREGRTLHHDCYGHFGSGKVIVRSAKPGTGIIAGGPMRAIFDLLGVADVVAKSVGSSNVHNIIKATFNAFENLSTPKSVADKRDKKASEITERRSLSEAKKG